MTENRSDARERAELVFSKLQAPSSVRDRAFGEINAIRAAGAEKTQKLREARMAKELRDKEAPTPVVSLLDQALALMQGLDAEDLAKIQSAAADRITALSLEAIKNEA